MSRKTTHTHDQCKARNGERILANRLVSGIFFHDLHDATFLNFKPTSTEEEEALRSARLFADTFQGSLRSTVTLTGLTESRRTHLGIAVGNAFLEEGLTVMYRVLSDLVREIGRAYKPGCGVAPRQVDAIYASVDLLILDDVQELLREEETKVFHNLLYSRDMLQRPTMVLSALESDRLRELVESRQMPRTDDDIFLFTALWHGDSSSMVQ